jgi:hypothetical protein
MGAVVELVEVLWEMAEAVGVGTAALPLMAL